MDVSLVIIPIISALAGGGLTKLLLARNLKVNSDTDTIEKLKSAHEADALAVSERMTMFMNAVTDLHDQMELLNAEIRDLRRIIVEGGLELPPRPRRQPRPSSGSVPPQL